MGKNKVVNWNHHTQTKALFRQSESVNRAGDPERRKNGH